MKQTPAMSAIETTTNIGTGALLAFLLTYFVLPFWGHAYSGAESLSITALYAAVSWVRSFAVRRGFEVLRK